jgi:hypothetical protein
MAKWQDVEDKNIRHIWVCDNEKGCPTLNVEAIVGPEWYQNNGTPVCSECDTDMTYQNTEVKS